MKIQIFSLIVFFSTLAFASGSIENKSLFTGSPESPGAFANCVVQQSAALLESNVSIVRMLHSGADTSVGKPWLKAEIAFIVEVKNKTKKKIYRTILTSTDINGWDLVQHSSGQIAPFSKSVAEAAELYNSSDELIGIYSLEHCKDL